MRIRTIKPEFLRHEKLQDLETSDPSAHVMLVFMGLWVASDREGRFEWRPRTLHLDILPFIPFDMAKTMELLEANGYINRYEANGVTYGQVVSWHRHQLIGRDEPPSEIPAPDGLLNAYHRPPNSTVRARIYQRDDYKCVYCGRSLQKDMRAICLDHVIPYDKRGSNTENNLATSCKPCNAKKSNRTPADAGMKWPDLLGEYYDGALTVAYRHVDTPLTVASQPSDKELEVGVEMVSGNGNGNGIAKTPPHPRQSDFDERDLKKINPIIQQMYAANAGNITDSDPPEEGRLNHRMIIEAAGRKAGLTPKRTKELAI